MSSVRLTDGRVLHIPSAPFVLDSDSVIMAPADAALTELVPLIPADDLLLFTGRLVTGARKRRRQPRYAEVNAARLRLARCCFGYDGKVMLPVADPVAIATLERAFTRLLQAGGAPMAVPISEAEASAFPHPYGKARHVPGGAVWLDVGVDVSGRVTYSMQSAGGEDKARP